MTPPTITTSTNSTLSFTLLALIIISHLHGSSSHVDVRGPSHSKRSDDTMVDDLKVLIQQQATVIQQQSADIQALQTKVATMENAASTRDKVLHKLQEKVAFTATFTAGGTLNTGHSAPIPFSHVTFNEGNGYDPRTGVFTAPVSGIYLFLLHVKSDTSATGSSSTSLEIVKSSTVIAYITVSGRHDEYHKSSISVTDHVTQGEKVFVRHSSGIILIDNWRETSLTGILLFVD